MNGMAATVSLSHLNGLEVVLDCRGEVWSALLVHQDRSESQGVVAVLPQRQVGLGDQLVAVGQVQVLVANLDVLRLHPRSRGPAGVEGEGDPADLGEPALQLGPLRHAVLQGGAELGPRHLQQHQGVHHGQDGQEIPEVKSPLWMDSVGPQSPGVEQSTVRVERGHHDVRDEVAQVGLLGPHRGESPVQRRGELAELLVHLALHDA